MGKCECCVYHDNGDGFCYEYKKDSSKVTDCETFISKCDGCKCHENKL